MSGHETERFCHYYNNQKNCPYEDIGCKFKHEWAPDCKFLTCKNILCQFKHTNVLEYGEKAEDDLEKEVIKEFEKDDRNVLSLKQKTGLDMMILVDVKSCKKCKFETHSEGELRKHEKSTHDLGNSNMDIIMGFKNDIKEYFNIFKDMGVGEEIEEMNCKICNFKTKSNGELKMHEQEMH